MKNITFRRLTILSTLYYFLWTLLFFIANYFSPNIYISLLVSVPVLIAAYSFYTGYFINRFIKYKVKPIYKTIHNVKPSRLAITLKSDKDPFKEVNQEITDWVQGKTQEIHQLREMEKYRKDFLGNVSHELKTPIFNIQGYILTLLDGGINDSNINILYLKRTEKSIDRMISIIEDLESISKLEAGELDINMEDFNLFQLIEDVFDSHEIRADSKEIDLQLNKLGRKQLMVRGDKHRLYQVFSNLVGNSISHGKQGGKTGVNFYDMDNRYLIEIKDNGIGIRPEDIPRIFERFYRVDKSRSREQGGTGLGLAIVKHLIEAHNQSINVTSTYGKGTSFTITLDKAKK
ncbi:two-component system, OmpR family, phosphate regulon sensor histidine kinase PhoR [Saccharicrinis carchari]|uniref:histidine kinase n=1 Tax=Saccharicrinis carchari TaxID=1168039 RepID=A0A521CMW4_SACCC|nr:ATP-binding protein [Saccharicrinis carchari]SMO60787.1 two-component system, OmpR family, phosphate regulon sensor histidine kinase PhoR [Saccharicrinis carchari]